MNTENTQLTNEDFSVYNGEGTVLRKAQLIMLEIIEAVDSICERNNIPYWLDYGTLLGAVRHKGFIPWDDDLDISVPYQYYDILRQALIEELPNHLVYQDWMDEKRYTFKHGKVRHKYSYFDEGLFERGELNFQGIFIDIFPVTEVFAPKLKNLIDSIYGRSFRRIRHLTDSQIEHFVGLLIWPFAYSSVLIYKLLNNFLKRRYITNIFGGVYNKNFYKKELIFPLKKIEFEGKKFLVPNETEKYLTYVFGDFMKIPPTEGRIVHAKSIEFLEGME